MPATNKKSRLADRKFGKKPQKKLPHRLIFIFLFLIFFLFATYLLLHTSWDKSKIALALQKDNGTAAIVILDPPNSSITTITIPANTQVQASNQLGTWKLGSISKLGVDEKLGGAFLKNTIIKSFKFPLDDFASSDFLDLISGNPSQIVKSIFTSSSSDLNIFDKMQIAFFALSVGNASRFDFDLQKTAYLNAAKLVDASLGWEIATTMPTNVEAYFTNDTIAKANLNVVIENAAQSNQLASTLGKTVEVLGANVAAIQTLPVDNLDCEITGLNKTVVTKIAKIFSCTISLKKGSNNFDIEIKFGTKFKERF